MEMRRDETRWSTWQTSITDEGLEGEVFGFFGFCLICYGSITGMAKPMDKRRVFLFLFLLKGDRSRNGDRRDVGCLECGCGHAKRRMGGLESLT